MKLAAKAIDYPRIVFLGTIIMAVMGGYAFYTLPIESDPRVQIPVVNVIVPNLGASPAANETEITREIEKMSGELDDLDYVVSSSGYGVTTVSFVFLESADIKEAKRDVQAIVDQVRYKFPKEAEEPFVDDISFKDFSVLSVGLRGGPNQRVLRQAAEDLADRLETVPGVSKVDVWGGLEREVQVQLHPHRLNLYGLRYDDVAAAVLTANAEAPTGTIDTDSAKEFRVRFRGKYANIEAVAATPLAQRNGKEILLRDVATVVDHHKRISTYAGTEGESCVIMEVRAKTDVNTLKTVARVKEIAKEEEKRLGPTYHVYWGEDEARGITMMLEQLGSNAFYGAAMVLVMVTIAMGFRNALLVCFAMPFSLLVMASLMLIAKHTIDEDLAINNMVLFSMILVLGLVVDGAVIVGENIYRHIEEGMSRYEAAKIGVVEVGAAVIGADLTAIAAFVPMIFVTGIMGQFMRVMPVAVAFAMGSSMLVDHFVLPMMARFLMRKRRGLLATIDAKAEELETMRLPSEDHRWTHAMYGRILGHCLHHRWIVLTGAVSGVVLALGIFATGLVGFEFFPKADIPFLWVRYELPPGASLDRTRDVGAALERVTQDMAKRGELYSAPLTIAGGSGDEALWMGSRFRRGPERGRILMELVDPEDRERSSFEIARWLRENLPNLPDVTWEVRQPSHGPPVGADVVIRVSGRQYTPLQDLERVATRIGQMLEEIPGTMDVGLDTDSRPETQVIPKPQIAALYGVTNEMIVRATQFALTGVEITEVDFGGQEDIDVRILNQKSHSNELKDLRDLPLRTPVGRHVTLGQVAEVKQIMAPSAIRHRDQHRVIQVVCYVDNEAILVDDVFARLQKQVAAAKDAGDPDFARNDITLFYGGENEERDKSFQELEGSVFLAIAIILVILVWQFNSFAQPLIIMFAIPLGFVGAIYGLMICGFNFSISAMIGMVALTGVVVNDAIVLVDFINQLRDKGMDLENAIIRGGQLRLRPIFLTLVTTIVGVLPIAVNLSGGAEFFQPLTVTLNFGLACATTLTLLVIPTMYFTYVRWAEGIATWWHKRENRQAVAGS